MAELIAIEDLPSAFRNITLSDAECDARHLVQIIGMIEKTTLPEFGTLSEEGMATLNRLAAGVYVLKDLAEALAWKLELIEAQERARRGTAYA